jgi:GxxExxY protein
LGVNLEVLPGSKKVDLESITRDALADAIAIHREFGPGLLESVYEALLARALTRRGYDARRQQGVRFEYDGIEFDEAFRADIVVEQRVIIEVKATSRPDPVAPRQLLTYLKLTRMPLGLVINFGGATLMEGVKRVINTRGPRAFVDAQTVN